MMNGRPSKMIFSISNTTETEMWLPRLSTPVKTSAMRSTRSLKPGKTTWISNDEFDLKGRAAL